MKKHVLEFVICIDMLVHAIPAHDQIHSEVNGWKR